LIVQAAALIPLLGRGFAVSRLVAGVHHGGEDLTIGLLGPARQIVDGTRVRATDRIEGPLVLVDRADEETRTLIPLARLYWPIE
jgi:hypothetical protein